MNAVDVKDVWSGRMFLAGAARTLDGIWKIVWPYVAHAIDGTMKTRLSTQNGLRLSGQSDTNI